MTIAEPALTLCPCRLHSQHLPLSQSLSLSIFLSISLLLPLSLPPTSHSPVCLTSCLHLPNVEFSSVCHHARPYSSGFGCLSKKPPVTKPSRMPLPLSSSHNQFNSHLWCASGGGGTLKVRPHWALRVNVPYFSFVNKYIWSSKVNKQW